MPAKAVRASRNYPRVGTYGGLTVYSRPSKTSPRKRVYFYVKNGMEVRIAKPKK